MKILPASLPRFVATLLATWVGVALAQAPVTNPVLKGFITPNVNLHVRGIAPIPEQIAADVARYADFRPMGFVAWHPKRREMLVRHRAPGASTAQLFWLKGPGQPLQAFTQAPEPVGAATVDRDGRFVVYAASKGGSEADQLYRQDMDPATGAPVGKPVLLTNERERHSRLGWFRVNGEYSGELMVASVPLDRFMDAQDRANVGVTVRLMDPLQPQNAKVMLKLAQTGWSGASLNRAGTTMYLSKFNSATESEIWSIDVQSGQRARLLPAPGDAPAVYTRPRLSTDGKHLSFISDRDGEFRGYMRLDLATGHVRKLTAGIAHDVEGVGSDDDDDDDAGRLHVRFNVNGVSELRAFDATTLAPIALTGLPAGNISGMVRRRGSAEFALNVNGASTPGDVFTFEPRQAQPTLWASAASAMDTSGFKPQQVVRWRSFDGLEISGLISRADARFGGKRPVLIDIHGGPESQARVGFAGRQNYYTQELGITVIRPNVRGSSGFGKTFLTLDNGFKREDSVKDIGALLDWIATQDDLDPARVLVSGGSYGGYMSLAVATHYAERIAGAIDVVGISNFVTFLETTESYRRDLRRVEYGDERDPAMRQHLIRISPLTNAHKITKPLFVIQGKNDPRVPYTEAEQIVAKARGNTVWYLRGENEGHGFARKENADFYFYSVVRFMQETLLKP